MPCPVETLHGRLEAFMETGSDGHHWAFHEDGKDGHDGLHFLKGGDVLRVFNDAAHKDKTWEGKIDLDLEAERKPNRLTGIPAQWIDTLGTVHGVQKGVAPETWAQMFIDGKPATLIRKKCCSHCK